MKFLNYKILFILLVVLIFLEFWSNKILPNIYMTLLKIVITVSVITIFIIKKNKIRKEMFFSNYVIALLLLSLISSLPAYFIHNQSFFHSISALKFQFIWLLYFVLHYFKIDKPQILKILFFYAIVWVILNLIQQFTYPNYWFYTRGDDEYLGKSIEIRMGVYRYMISGIFVIMFTLFYSWQKFLNKDKTLLWLLMSIIFMAGIYMHMTRQIIVVVLFLFLISTYINKISIKSILNTFLILIILSPIYFFKEQLFGDLIELTNQQVDDNIRYETYYFYGLHYWNGFFSFLLGNGIPYNASNYGQEILSYNDIGYYRSDIGIVGILNQYGLFYTLSFLILIYNFFRKYFSVVSLYLKMFFLSLVFLSPMIFILIIDWGIVIFLIFLYLCDLEIYNKKYEIHDSNISI